MSPLDVTGARGRRRLLSGNSGEETGGGGRRDRNRIAYVMPLSTCVVSYLISFFGKGGSWEIFVLIWSDLLLTLAMELTINDSGYQLPSIMPL